MKTNFSMLTVFSLTFWVNVSYIVAVRYGTFRKIELKPIGCSSRPFSASPVSYNSMGFIF